MRLRYVLLMVVFGLGITGRTQIVVDTAVDPLTLNTFLTGFGMTISNLTVTCDPASIGTFISNGSNIGMSDGLALSSGRVKSIPGPNDNGSTSGDMGQPGDIDLSATSGHTTYDACIVEFDCVPQFNLLQFNYVFGSEEYLEFANTGFNDVFAIYITGPGINGQENIALIPGTTTPVTIDNVNDLNNPAYYNDNGDGFSPPQNADTMVIQYDGFTVNLLGETMVQPGETYHLKFAVADAGDLIYDSGVMIEANSVRSSPSVGISETLNALNAHVLWDPQAQDHILVYANSEIMDLTILDIRGSIVRTWREEHTGPVKLDSRSLKKGAYILMVEEKNSRAVLRFVN